MNLAPGESDFLVEPGALLLDRYRVESHLATGGMGEVWLGRDLRLGSSVAIKFSRRTEDRARRRFQAEAEIAARLPGAHIVRVFDRGEIGPAQFLVMEYLHGETLRQRLTAEGRLSATETLRLMEQTAEGLSHAHASGVVHRDIKPENLFLVGNAQNAIVKLLDFGVAKAGATQTSTGDWVGTPLYASPEQLADASRLEPTTDLWSLAVVCYECLTGERPFQSGNLGKALEAIASGRPTSPAWRTLTPRQRHWFERAFAPQVADRPQTATSFLLGLKGALVEEAGNAGGDKEWVTTITAARTEKFPPAGRSSSRSRFLQSRLLWGSALAALALAGVWALTMRHSPSAPHAQNPPPTASSAWESSFHPEEAPTPAPWAFSSAVPNGAEAMAPAVERGTVPPVTLPTKITPGTQAIGKKTKPSQEQQPAANTKVVEGEGEEDELLWSRRK